MITMSRTAVIDPHVHLWDQRKTPREASALVKVLGWNRGLMHWVARRAFPKAALSFFADPKFVLGDYLEADYLADADARELRGFVHIEAGWVGKGPMAPVAETQWLESLDMPLLKGIVGRVDLCSDAVDEVLAAHLAASPRFRGVRQILSHHPDRSVMNGCDEPDLYEDERWRSGFAQLAARDLSFEATVYEHQLGGVAKLAAAFPKTTIVVCHAGTPVGVGGPFGAIGLDENTRATILDRWRGGMSRLAELPNVYVKLSGLAMPCLGWGYHEGAAPDASQVARDFGPLLDHAIDAFGASRCMFASNFPVDKVSMSWSTLYDAFDRAVSERSAEECRALFHDTAAAVYRLELDDGQSLQIEH